MNWMLRIAVLLLATGTFAIAVPASSPASVQTGPALTVTPHTGLVGGQVVSVDGSGFAPSTRVAMCQGVLTANPSQSDCAGGDFVIEVADATGAFTAPFTVARFIRPRSTSMVIDCAQSVQCGIGAAADTLPLGPVAVATLDFAPQPPTTFTIKGSVVGPELNALAGVAVSAYVPADSFVGSFRTTTDAKGAYQLDISGSVTALRFGPPAGTDLVAEWYYYWPLRRLASILSPPFPSAFNDPVIPLATQGLAAGGAIAGVVTRSGVGVAGVTVWAYGPGDTKVGSFGTRTLADGSYRIPGVRPAHYKVRFMPPNTSRLAIQWYDNATVRGVATSVTVTQGSTTTGIDAQLSPTP